MLKRIDGLIQATHEYRSLYWDGYFCEPVFDVINKLRSGRLSEVRGSYSLIYKDIVGVSQSMSYPVFQNGDNISTDPRDLGVTLDYNRLQKFLEFATGLNTDPVKSFDFSHSVFDFYNIFTPATIITPTERLIKDSWDIEDFIKTIEVNTHNKRVGIMFSDGWDSWAMLEACRQIGIDPLLITVERDNSNISQLGHKYYSSPAKFLEHDFSEVCVPFTSHNWCPLHELMVSLLVSSLKYLPVDVVLRGNEREGFTLTEKISKKRNTKDAQVLNEIPVFTVRNDIVEYLTGVQSIDPFVNLKTIDSILTGYPVNYRQIVSNPDLVISNKSVDFLYPTAENYMLENLKWLTANFNLSNSTLKEIAGTSNGQYLNRIIQIVRRYV